MIEAIDKFIIYMLTENDKEKIIYSKLNKFEGEKLKSWATYHLKSYLVNWVAYDDYEEDEEGDTINEERISEWINKDCDIDICDIFNGSCGEIMRIQRELIEYNDNKGYDWFHYGIEKLTFNEDILECYCIMYIEKMTPTELKEYIINLIDPVEPK